MSYSDKLHMQKLREQGLGEKTIISSYKLKKQRVKVEYSTVKKVCNRVGRIGSGVLCKPGSETGRPATASAFAICRIRQFPLVGPTEL